MTIPDKLIEKWMLLRSQGDGVKIAELAATEGIECSDETVNRALRTGKVNDDLFKLMAEYYEQKAEMVKAYL
jgi:hypothetical protein